MSDKMQAIIALSAFYFDVALVAAVIGGWLTI